MLEEALRLRELMYAESAKGEPNRLVRSRRFRFIKFRDCFVGSEAVSWVIRSQSKLPNLFGASETTTEGDVDRAQVTRLLDGYIGIGAFSAVAGKATETFKDVNTAFYRWKTVEKMHAMLAQAKRSSQINQLVHESPTTMEDIKEKLLRIHSEISSREKAKMRRWEKEEKPSLLKEIADLEQQLQQAEKTALEVESSYDGKVSISSLDKLDAKIVSLTQMLDQKKAVLYFPGSSNEWELRLGGGGFYVASRQVNIESVNASWEISGEQDSTRNGTQLEMTLSPMNMSVSLEDFSIISSSGMIPKLFKHRVTIAADLSVNISISYDFDQKIWVTNKCDVKVEEFKRAEGTVLPASLITWLINQFVPSIVKNALKESLLEEVATLLADQKKRWFVAGNLSLFGVPLSVIEREFKLGANVRCSPEIQDAVRSLEFGGPYRKALKLMGGRIALLPLQGHLLYKARRRLGLSPMLKRQSLWSECSKWTSVANVMKYVQTMERLAKPEEFEECMQLWQRAINSFAVEDGIESFSIEAMFANANKISRDPLEITFLLSNVELYVNIQLLLDALHAYGVSLLDKGNKAKKKRRASVMAENTDAGEALESMRRKLLEDFFANIAAQVKSVANSLQHSASASFSGQLLGGGETSIIDVGGECVSVSLAPEFHGKLGKLDLHPSNSAMSLYCRSTGSGKASYIIDLGQPLEEFDFRYQKALTEEMSDPNVYESMRKIVSYEDPLQILELSGANSRVGEFQLSSNHDDISLAYGDNTTFPEHERLAYLTMGKIDAGLKLDLAKLAETMEKDNVSSGKLEMFSMHIQPREDISGIELATRYLPGTVFEANVEDFHMVGNPARITQWSSKWLHEDDEKRRRSDQMEKDDNDDNDDGEFPLYVSAMETALSSLVVDLQSKSMVGSFAITVDIQSKEDGLCVEMKNGKTQSGRDAQNAAPVLLFQNVYYMRDLAGRVHKIIDAYVGNGHEKLVEKAALPRYSAKVAGILRTSLSMLSV